MISAVNLAQRQAIGPKIQKQHEIRQNKTNYANISFKSKPNWQAASVMGAVSLAALGFSLAEIANIVAQIQTIGPKDGLHIFESIMGLTMGTGAGFAAVDAALNKPKHYDFLEKYHFKP